MKFLVDECLSPALARMAQERGFGESSHIVWMRLGGKKDWELKPVILDGDWTFVTKNSIDFRGPSQKPGSKGQYADVALHTGLICLNGPPGMDLDMQVELFEAALDALEDDADLVNQVREVTIEEDEALRILRHAPSGIAQFNDQTREPPCRGSMAVPSDDAGECSAAAPPIRRISAC